MIRKLQETSRLKSQGDYRNTINPNLYSEFDDYLHCLKLYTSVLNNYNIEEVTQDQNILTLEKHLKDPQNLPFSNFKNLEIGYSEIAKNNPQKKVHYDKSIIDTSLGQNTTDVKITMVHRESVDRDSFTSHQKSGQLIF